MSSQVPVPAGVADVRYFEAGLNLDCKLREHENHALLDIAFEISNFVPPEEKAEVKTHPLIRSIRSEIATAVLPGKPTVVSTVDDTATKRRYELEVTATKVK